MKSKQLENPLKPTEEQLDRILFENTEIPLKRNMDVFGKLNNKSDNNMTNFKNRLIFLVKELNAKKLHLVA